MPTLLRGECRGFSLFELLVVVILLAAAAAVVLPSFTSGLSGLELETAGRDLVTRMRQARGEAISRQKVFRVILYPGAGPSEPSYYVVANEFGQPLETYPLPEGVRFAGDPEEFPLRVSFYPNGRSSGGSVLLENRRNKKIQLWVDAVTGFGKVLKGDEPFSEVY